MKNTQSNTVPSIFTFAEKHNVRIEIVNGEPWFCANDVCDILEHSNSRKAISDLLDEDDVTKRYTVDALNRDQETNFISEYGIYSLILGSQLPAAKAFKRWVTHEVLPQLRKMGFYGQLELKERIALGNQMLGIIDRLGKTKDAFVRAALMGRLREVCLLLGQSIPDQSYLGKDADQMALPGL